VNTFILSSLAGQTAANKWREAYSFLQILERKPEYDEAHGPKRLAILFLFADGIATYDALFCQTRNKLEPFAILLHAQIKPTYLLVVYNTRPWRDYTKLEDVAGAHGGMHDMAQYLHKRN
jgi:hypothetical protein